MLIAKCGNMYLFDRTEAEHLDATNGFIIHLHLDSEVSQGIPTPVTRLLLICLAEPKTSRSSRRRRKNPERICPIHFQSSW
ncbi:hypothetical protein J6590_006629 [Homalodisca vitripennis]|nr:hypothetical protein J6590_006629 [Homalodisca vitripennis]